MYPRYAIYGRVVTKRERASTSFFIPGLTRTNVFHGTYEICAIDNFVKIKASENLKGQCRAKTVNEVINLELTAISFVGFVKSRVICIIMNDDDTCTTRQFCTTHAMHISYIFALSYNAH